MKTVRTLWTLLAKNSVRLPRMAVVLAVLAFVALAAVGCYPANPGGPGGSSPHPDEGVSPPQQVSGGFLR